MSPKAPEEPRSATSRGCGRRTSSFYREEIVGGGPRAVAGEQRTSRMPSGWTPIELLSHVLHMEQRWFVWGFLGEEVEPWGDWTRDDPWDVPAPVDRSRDGRYPTT